LMPGFLGTEVQFNKLYGWCFLFACWNFDLCWTFSKGKPILASRDAKASSVESEAGTLALEALHRQVKKNGVWRKLC
jgi:TATA-binding protein-associated factor